MTTVTEIELGLCPNCTDRRADTFVDYYEVVSSEYSTHAATRTRRGVRWRKSWVSGKVRLCSQCASLYNRSVMYRQRGRRVIKWSAAGIVGGGILYLILQSQVPALSHGIWALALTLPALVAFVFLCIGLVFLAMGTLLKRRGAYFLEKRLKS